MKDPIVKRFAIFCIISVVLVALWAMWYIGGNSKTEGKQWCAVDSIGTVHCTPTLSSCERETEGFRIGKCLQVNSDKLFYCGGNTSYYGCSPIRGYCPYGNIPCELMTYDRARQLDPSHLL